MSEESLGEVGRSIRELPFSMVVCDARIDDCPIVYVNEAFERTTLYSRDRAIGVNCRFLQGERTRPEDVRRIREGLAGGDAFAVDVLNYRADGTEFHNRLLISPLDSADGERVGFLGIQQLLSDPRRAPRQELELLREVQHRVKNHLAMIVGLIRLQSRSDITRSSFESLARRIESLSLLYDELSGRGVAMHGQETVPAGAYLSRVAAVLTALDVRQGVRIGIDCEQVTLSAEQAARLGLILSELLTNALRHAFVGRDGGLIEVRLQGLGESALRLTVTDDGVGFPSGSRWPHDAPSVAEQRLRLRGGNEVVEGGTARGGMGGTIVRTMVESLDGHISVVSPGRGTICTLDVSV